MGKHYLSNMPKSFEQRAKISASGIVSKEEHPDLWKQLADATLKRMLILEKIRGITRIPTA